MQIENVSVHNFRSLADCTFHLNDYSLLVGANNTGKSNTIDALRIFFEVEKFDRERDFTLLSREDEEIWIEVEFLLTDEEQVNLEDDLLDENNLLKIRKYLDKGPSGRKGFYTHVDSTNFDKFCSLKDVKAGKLGDVIYIPSVSKIEDETKLTGPSPLRALLNNILNDLLQSSRAFDDLKQQFANFSQSLKQEETESELSLASLEGEINDELDEWSREFNLRINPPAETDIVKNLIDYTVIDNDIEHEIDATQQGHGFQRHLIFTLIRLAAKYQSMDDQSEQEDFYPDFTAILFEEPEAFLHPIQQDTLCKSLKTIASRSNNQVIVSSHSPIFVSQNTDDLPSIMHLCRENAYTKVGQISSETLDDLFSDNQRINEILQNAPKNYQPHPDDCKQDMEAIKYFIWLNPERCGMFFAKHVLLVEGASERILLNYLLDTGEIKMPEGGVFILDAFGKFNFHRFMNILCHLKIHHSVLLDGDLNKPPHPEIRELIEDSRNPYTLEIGEFKKDIEDFLGIDKPGRSYRKPQHIMLRLEEGQIQEENIEALVELVNDVIHI